MKKIIISITILVIAIVFYIDYQSKIDNGIQPSDINGGSNETVETLTEIKQLKISDTCAVLIPAIKSGTEPNPRSNIPVGATQNTALVKSIDYKNKTITLDYVTVKLKNELGMAGYETEIINDNNKLRTFTFDDNTLVYLEYLGMTSFYEKIKSDKDCQKEYAMRNIEAGDWGWYSLAKLPLDTSEGSPDFQPYIEATALGDKLLFLLRPTLTP